MKCCVYTRSFMEHSYMDFFIEHYIKLGFDKIFILKSDNIEYKCPNEYEKQVYIHKVPNIGDKLLKSCEHLVLRDYEYDWILSVDTDEILLLNKKYNNNIKNYIEEKTKINPDINAFYFRWGMVEKYDITDTNTLPYILNNYKIFTNGHIKSMIKKSSVKSICHPHYAVLKSYHIYFENKILTANKANQHKINECTFEDEILIHIHTRSIHNLIIKALCTKLHGKGVSSGSKLKELINNFDINNSKNILDEFKKHVGSKATLPYGHSNYPCSHFNSEKFLITDYKYDVIHNKKEEAIISKLLQDNNINETKYYQFINELNKIIKNEKRFMK